MAFLICDLDGVIWTGNQVHNKVRESFNLLAQHQIEILFVSNNSFRRVSEIEGRLRHLGSAKANRVITSSMVTAAYLPEQSRVCAEVGLGTKEQLLNHQHQICEWNEDPEFVVMGLVTHFDYSLIDRLMQAISTGATLIGTNDDPTFPTADGIKPGGGALLMAVATAASVTPVIMGKPHPPMIEYVSSRNQFSSCLGVVGDRFDQDGQFAKNLNLPFLLVESPATAESKNCSTSVSPALQTQSFWEVSNAIVSQ